MGSFSFRLACYDQFGWGYRDVRELPESEAAMLSIYFEETGAYQAQQQRDAKRRADSHVDSHDGWEITEELNDDDLEDDDE